MRTQSGHGTGFLSLYNEDQTFCGVAQDVSHFHEVASTIQSIDEANKKKAELEKSQHTEQELDNGEPPTAPDAQNNV